MKRIFSTTPNTAKRIIVSSPKDHSKSMRQFPRVQKALSIYAERISAFHPDARLYLLSVVATGAALGVYRLLFNFYVLSLGYNEALLGTLITTSSLTALIAALPMGYLADLLGRKNSLILSTALLGA